MVLVLGTYSLSGWVAMGTYPVIGVGVYSFNLVAAAGGTNSVIDVGMYSY